MCCPRKQGQRAWPKGKARDQGKKARPERTRNNQTYQEGARRTRRSQKEPKGARRSQREAEGPKGARRTQKKPAHVKIIALCYCFAIWKTKGLLCPPWPIQFWQWILYVFLYRCLGMVLSRILKMYKNLRLFDVLHLSKIGFFRSSTDF